MAEKQRTTGQKKLEIVSQLFELAFALKLSALKQKHVQASPDELKKMVLESIERGTR